VNVVVVNVKMKIMNVDHASVSMMMNDAVIVVVSVLVVIAAIVHDLMIAALTTRVAVVDHRPPLRHRHRPHPVKRYAGLHHLFGLMVHSPVRILVSCRAFSLPDSWRAMRY
jgi:hypothetical protein